MFKLLKVGSSGPDVKELQQLLNAKLGPLHAIVPDGSFGQLTKTAVIKFQKANWLSADGIVGPCSMNALKGTERFAVLKAPPRLIPQPTPMTCWAASTAMLTGKTVPQVIAQARAGGVQLAPDDGIFNESNQDDTPNYRKLATAFGLTMLPPMSWMPEALANLMNARGMLMFSTLWNVADYTGGLGSPGHVRILAGTRGDGTGEGTTVLIYDPWSPNVGKIESRIYGPFIRENPATNYKVFHK